MSVTDAYIKLRPKAKSTYKDHYDLACNLMMLKSQGVDLATVTYEQVNARLAQR